MLFILVSISAYKHPNGYSSSNRENFKDRTANLNLMDSSESCKSYLSVFLPIYSLSEHKTYYLTVTTSIRNIGLKDTNYITKAQYFDTHAEPIHSYFQQPIFIAPLKTIEIVIDEVDQAGGTGANFIFDWK